MMKNKRKVTSLLVAVIVFLPTIVNAHEAGLSELEVCGSAGLMTAEWRLENPDRKWLLPVLETSDETLGTELVRWRTEEYIRAPNDYAYELSDDEVVIRWKFNGEFTVEEQLEIDSWENLSHGHRVLVSFCPALGFDSAMLSAKSSTLRITRK